MLWGVSSTSTETFVEPSACARKSNETVVGRSGTVEPEVMLFINFFSMPEVNEDHHEPLVVGLVKDAVAA
jgi:hypothetical protein